MQTKHFVNDPDRLVNHALKSLSITHPGLSLDVENKIIYAPPRQDGRHQVSIVSGGGAGHEPSFTGFVGDGILTAAVSGTIFASPSSRQILAAVEGVDSTKGVLVTVMNYTGDVMNFGVALEKAKARDPQLQIQMLLVGDDVAVTRTRAGKVGRRGIAGTLLVHKVTGAAAANGSTLDEVLRVGRLVAANLVSIGVSLSRVHVPGRRTEETSQHSLAADEVELGMGIHNESGCEKRRGHEAGLPSIIQSMLRQLLDEDDPERSFLDNRGNKMVLLVNNLGALSVLELGAVVTEVTTQLQQTYQVELARVYASTYMTSLDGPGFSISLLNAFETGMEHDLTALLDAPSNTLGWNTISNSPDPVATHLNERSERNHQEEQHAAPLLVCDMGAVLSRLDAGLKEIIKFEPEITKYDSIVGDGDCGTTLRRGAEAILESISQSSPSNMIVLLTRITFAVESVMDGTSGALYSIFLNNLTHYFKLKAAQASQPPAVTAIFWIEALTGAVATLSKYTPAKVGDRTVMDALIPFIDALRTTVSLSEAAKAAREGTAMTKAMRPALGRTVYIGNEDTWLGKVPDPGALGLSKFFDGISKQA